jgi:hypothetical protein
MLRKRYSVTSRPKFVLIIHQILKMSRELSRILCYGKFKTFHCYQQDSPLSNCCMWNLTFLQYRLWDELRILSCTYKCRHDAAADLIHMYAYTKCFFRIRVSHILLPIFKVNGFDFLINSFKLTQVWPSTGLRDG